MDDPPQLPPPLPAAKQVSHRTLWLAVVVSAVVSAVVVVGIMSVPQVRRLVAESEFVQTGRFQVLAGVEGEVNFPYPYELPPNVVLTGLGSFEKTLVSKVKSTGFKWKNTGADDIFNRGERGWVAKGVRATSIPRAQ